MEPSTRCDNKRDFMKAKAIRLLKELGFEKIPSWATHVAVSHTKQEVELCRYLEEIGEYIDEDPSHLDRDEWVGSYREDYWDFFNVELFMGGANERN